MKRAAVVVGVLILLALAGAGIGYRLLSREPADVRGSSTEEFVTTEEPATKKRQANAVANTPWPLYGYDHARTRDAPEFDVRPPYRKIWARRLGNLIEFPPVVAYDGVYVAQWRGRLFKFRARDGKILWRKHFHHCSAASPAAGRRTLYVVLMMRYPCERNPRTQRGLVVALNVVGGKQRWRFGKVGVVESSPLLVDKTLYFGSWDHKLYALYVGGKKPRVKWTFTADDELNSSPAYASGRIFIASNAGSVYAVDAGTGRMRWRAQSFSHFPRGREYFYATVAVAYGRVYASNTDGYVYAFGARSGRLLWARHVGTYVYTAPAIWRKRIYVGTYDGWVYALDAATGDVRWRRPAESSLHGAPAVVNGVVYFSTCGTCGHRGSRHAKLGPRVTFALDARTGRRLWQFPDGKYSAMVADQDRIYIVGKTRLYGFEPRAKHRAAKAAAAKKKAEAAKRRAAKKKRAGK